MTKRGLYASVATAIALVATQASAQSQAPAPAADQSAGIQDIIVTAQRFTETAQKTPLVITTINSDDLTGVSDVKQLQSITPGVSLSAAGNVVTTFVRGVGTLAATNTQESAVSYNVDGVFMFTSSMITPLMYDLERVEVLKGPQGTLYGRNASGGAVNLITTGAKLGQVSGYAEGELGNYDLRRVTGAVNLPLGDTLAIRLAGQHVEHDGYLSDGMDDQDVSSGRLRLLWEPSTAVKLQVGGDISRTNAFGAGGSLNPNPTGDKFLGGLDPRAQTGLPPVVVPGVGTFPNRCAAAGVPDNPTGQSLLSCPPNTTPYYHNNQWSTFAQLDADLGFATLTILPAYRREKVDSLTYIPGYAYAENTTTRQKSLEARLSNRSDALKWVAGAYYFRVNQRTTNILNNDVNYQGARVDYRNHVESYAFFGEATLSLTEQFRVIGGLRYSHERTWANGIANANDGPPTLPNPQTPDYNPYNPVTNPTGEFLDYPVDNSVRGSAVTWKAGLEYDLAPESLLFFTASRGFKGGGTYVDIPGTDSSFKPEFLTAFELGSRNRFLDNRLQLNFEGFYWRLKDQQIPYVGFNEIAQVTFLTKNAGKAHMYGGSVDLTYKLTPDDTFHFAAEYVKSKYDSFVRVVPSLAVLPTTHCAVGADYDPTPGSTSSTTLDCSGQTMLRAPKWSGSTSYEHRFELGNDSSITFNGEMTFSSASWLEANYTSLMRQKATALFNARLGYTSPGGVFGVTAWVRNIANTRVMTGGGQFLTYYARPTLMPPRTAGVSARINF